MYLYPVLDNLNQLSPEEVSQAWEYLDRLWSPDHPQPSLPPNLSHLHEEEWLMLGQLLRREQHLRLLLPLH
jgi:hypothetical protein